MSTVRERDFSRNFGEEEGTRCVREGGSEVWGCREIPYRRARRRMVAALDDILHQLDLMNIMKS